MCCSSCLIDQGGKLTNLDTNPLGSSIQEILQARILERVAMPSSRDLANPGIEPGSPAWQADSLSSEPPGKHTPER